MILIDMYPSLALLLYHAVPDYLKHQRSGTLWMMRNQSFLPAASTTRDGVFRCRRTEPRRRASLRLHIAALHNELSSAYHCISSLSAPCCHSRAARRSTAKKTAPCTKVARPSNGLSLAAPSRQSFCDLNSTKHHDDRLGSLLFAPRSQAGLPITRPTSHPAGLLSSYRPQCPPTTLAAPRASRLQISLALLKPTHHRAMELPPYTLLRRARRMARAASPKERGGASCSTGGKVARRRRT